MRTAGIIAEYNPFHKGHLYHMQRTREITGCDYLIAAMVGSFTQRGEPALADKWERARGALSCGADLVLELPALFAVRPAQVFARGGVGLLGALGVVDALSFGCEYEDIHLLSRMAGVLRDEPPRFRELLRAGLAEGKSYPRARGEALEGTLGLPPGMSNAPNLALALEYLKENAGLNRPMRPVPILRTRGYHDGKLGDQASAGAIRAAVFRGLSVEEALPVPLKGPLSRPEALDELLLYKLRGMGEEELRKLPDMPEGLERRILKMAEAAGSREELIGLIKCKRYTRARISRCLTWALLDMEEALCRRYPAPPYARVLGFRERARPLLRAIRRAGAIPLASDPVPLKDHPCFALERRATDLWGLSTEDPGYRRSGRDLTHPLVRL